MIDISTAQSLAGVLLSAARTYVDQEEWDAAEQCIRELHALEPPLPPDEPENRLACRLEGEVARGRGDHAAAETIWTQCFEADRAAGDSRGAAKTLWFLGDLMLQSGRMSEAAAHLQACLVACQAPDLLPLRARALESVGSVYRLRGQFDDAIESFTAALDIRERTDDLEGVARNHAGLGNTHYRMGDLDAAVEHHQRSLDVCESIRDDRGVAKSLNNLGTVFLQRGDYRGARDHFERAHSLVTAIGDARILSNVVSNLGLIASYEGDAAQAEAHYAESLTLREATRDLPGQAISLNNLAQIALASGRNQDALDFASRSIDIRERAGLRDNMFRAWFNLAQAHLELNQLQAAEHAAERVRALTDGTASVEGRVQAELALASIALAREDATAAGRHAASAADTSKAHHYRRGYGEALALRGQADLLAGNLDVARSVLIECEATFRDLHSPFHLANCQLSLGQLFLRVGAPEAAAARLRQAADTFGKLGNEPRRWTCLVALADAQWPLSHHQSRVTLAAAADLARRIGRDDLLLRATTMSGELATREAVAATAGGDAGPLLALSGALRECDDASSILDTALRTLVDQFDLDLAVADAHDAEFGRVGPHPADATVPAHSDALVEEATRRRQARFTWGDPDEGERARFELAIPIIGLRRSPAGALFVCGSESVAGDFRHRSPQSLPLLEGAAFVIGLALQAQGRVAEPSPEMHSPDDSTETFGMIGKSAALRRVHRLIERIAPSDASVLIQGESGTGKELAARAIHAASPRAEHAFVAISCPSIPKELIEAELFGHERGAFTGAHIARPGQVELADGGTLFLDEIGDMDLAMQSKVLRFLQEREFQHVGGRKTLRVDVRVLAATSRDLEAEVRAGHFREDLYYRISVAPIRLPALQTRLDDVPYLLAHFFGEFAGERPPKTLTQDALNAFMSYRWPGNIRELRNLVEFLVAMVPGELIDLSDLPPKVRASAATHRPRIAASDDEPLRSGETLEARMMTVEGSVIRWALESSDWNQSKAAKALGITETKIRNRMKRYGIERPE